MQLQTPVENPRYPFRLTPSSRVVVTGSCFAEHMGERLRRTLPPEQVAVNPFGVVYNPMSIATGLRWLMSDRPFDDTMFFEGRTGVWHSRLHSGAFSGATEAECREKVCTARATASRLLETAELLIVTWGTSRAYRLKTDGRIVANCHKEAAADFEECDPSLDALCDDWRTLINELHDFNPRLHLLFTVSPYRYAKYGLHASQVAKAKLLLLADELCGSRTQTHYFPSYEIVMDELRDYRFYKPDMFHPSEQTVDYIARRFGECCFDVSLHEFSAERATLLRDLSHRPLHPDSAAHRHFAENLERRLQVFLEKWGVSVN